MLADEYISHCRVLMPETLPVRLAAALVEQKEETFRARALPEVATPDGRVSLAALERWKQREFGSLEYLSALHSLRGVRQRKRAKKNLIQSGGRDYSGGGEWPTICCSELTPCSRLPSALSQSNGCTAPA